MQQLLGCRGQVTKTAVHKELHYLLPTFQFLICDLGTFVITLTTPAQTAPYTAILGQHWRNVEDLEEQTELVSNDDVSMRFVRDGDRVHFSSWRRCVEIDCGPIALALLIERLRALDVPELPESSRVALHEFLADSAQLL